MPHTAWRQFGDKKRGLKSFRLRAVTPRARREGQGPQGLEGDNLGMSLQMKREPA